MSSTNSMRSFNEKAITKTMKNYGIVIYLPLDDTTVNEAQHHQPVHLMKIHFVIRWKRQGLPFHWHTNHHAYAHVLDATIQIDGYVDLFQSIPQFKKIETTN